MAFAQQQQTQPAPSTTATPASNKPIKRLKGEHGRNYTLFDEMKRQCNISKDEYNRMLVSVVSKSSPQHFILSAFRHPLETTLREPGLT
jgi:hypothetical protein